MRVLGLDPGGKRLGLAVADTASGVATPLRVVECSNRAEMVEIVVRTMAEHGAERVVIGLPTDGEGSETGACRRSHALADALAQRGVVAELQPEYLSSNEARRRARALRRRPSAPVDDLAAQVILEDYLSTVTGGGARP